MSRLQAAVPPRPGFFILEAADVAAMAPGTHTGAAHTVTAFGKPDDVMMKKIENDAAAEMRSVFQNAAATWEIAESAVRESKSFTEQEALDKKLVDYLASDEQDLFQQISRKAVQRFDGQPLLSNCRASRFAITR